MRAETDLLHRPADPVLPAVYRVVETRAEAPGVTTIRLQAAGPRIDQPAPGQFNMLYVPGVGESAISVSAEGADPGELVHTIRDVGAVSHALTRLSPGDEIGVRGPYGAGWPLEGARGHHVIAVAGGLGIAPLRPAIRQIAARPEDFASLSVVFGARAPSDLMFAEEMAELARAPDVRLETTVDHADPGWTGSVGVVTRRLGAALEGRDPARTTAFVCGPEVMMRHTARALEAAGIDAGAIWLSLERNMKCAVGFCGHCQFGADFICRDGPVLPYAAVRARLDIREY